MNPARDEGARRLGHWPDPIEWAANEYMSRRWRDETLGQWPDPSFGACRLLEGRWTDDQVDAARYAWGDRSRAYSVERFALPEYEEVIGGLRVRDLFPTITTTHNPIVYTMPASFTIDGVHPEVQTWQTAFPDDRVHCDDWSPDLAGGMTIDELLGMSEEWKR